MPGSTLLDIKNAVRVLTGRPGPNQLSDAALTNWINQYYVFDFPREVRTPELRVNINILLNAHQQSYPLDQFTTNLALPNITNYQGWITSIYPPVYCGGRQIALTQSQTEFYNYNPKNQQVFNAGTGTGAPLVITFTIPAAPLIRGQVVVSAQDANGNAIRRRDDSLGGFIDQNNNAVTGAINYITGVVTALDMGTPAVGVPINAYSNGYNPSWPNMMLFFNNILSFWPIPDQGYQVTFEADITLPDMVNDGDQPLQREWWQVIAYGTAIKILRFYLENETIDALMPEYERQLDFVNRKLITQQSINRTPTIYASQDSNLPFLNNSFSNQG